MPFDTRLVPQCGRRFLLPVLLTLSSTAPAQSGGQAAATQAPPTGSVCLLSTTDPTPGEKSLYNYSGGNPTPDYSVQFGTGSIVAIPHSPDGAGPGVLVTGLSLAGSHLVRIRHEGKPLESFRFRFEEKDRGRRCLFLKELYLTWQLWPAHQFPPACKCTGATITPWVERTAQPLFTQHERQSHAAARPNPRCQPEPYETPITYSELAVFDSREVVYQMSTVVPCLSQVGDPPFARRWDAPSETASVFRHTLSAPEFEQFKMFLDRADVQGIQSFMNAGPGVGDFKIAVARRAGPQNIEVASLNPDHFQLVNDPSLIHLVCKAKDMARIASRSGELPEWCRKVRPLNPPK